MISSVTYYSLLRCIRDLRSLIDIDLFEQRVHNIINAILPESLKHKVRVCKSPIDGGDKILYVHRIEDGEYVIVINYTMVIDPTIGLTPEEITALILVAIDENLLCKTKQSITNNVMEELGPSVVIPSTMFRDAGDNTRLIGARAIFNYYNTMTDFTSDRGIYYVNNGDDHYHSSLTGIEDLYKNYKIAVYKISSSLGVDVFDDAEDYYKALQGKITTILKYFKIEFENSRNNNDDSRFLNDLQKYYNSTTCEILKRYLTPHLNRMSKANYAGACITEAYAILNEGLFDSNIYKKMIKNDADADINRMIDRISLDIEGVKELDDKYYVTNKIHDQLRICADVRKELLKKYKEQQIKNQLNTISEYESRLNDLRARVLAMEIKKKRYGVFAEVPAGYEG